jgi:hypothetical protein
LAFTASADNQDVLDVAKAGRIIPLNWRITDASGNPITGLAEVGLTVVGLVCDEGENPEPAEECAAGNSGLQNLGDGYYQGNWKTSRSYAACKTLKVNLGEGAAYEHLALFQFR